MDGTSWVCFFGDIHLSRTWMSGSFESVRWNACVHRLDLGSYSHPKEFWGNGVRTHINSKGISKGKTPSTGSPEEDRSHNAASRTQGAQHTTDWAIPALSDCFIPNKSFTCTNLDVLSYEAWRHASYSFWNTAQVLEFSPEERKEEDFFDIL